MFFPKKVVVFSLVIMLSLAGCGTKSNVKTGDVNNDQVQFSKLNASGSANQQISNQAKELIIKFDDIKAIHAVNSHKKLVATFEIDHIKRFNLQETKKDIEEMLEREINDIDIVVSTDKKIIIKLEELEDDIKVKDLSEKDINKRLKKIIKLSKEQT